MAFLVRSTHLHHSSSALTILPSKMKVFEPGHCEWNVTVGTKTVLNELRTGGGYGLDALGQKIRDAGFRAERMAEFLHKDVKDRLEARDIAALALSCHGGRKGVAEDIQYRVVLNKADTEERRRTALEVWKEMERIRGCCGMREVRTVVVGR